MTSFLAGLALDLLKAAAEEGKDQLKAWHTRRQRRKAREAIEWALRQQDIRRQKREQHMRDLEVYNRTGAWPDDAS